MAAQTINGKILLRNDTAANWVTKNPTLGVGEVGIETDTGKAKVGDGTTAWNHLGYSFGIYNITEGSTNGTISVDGTDVAVKGLGSRAYDSTSYLPLSGGTMTGTIVNNSANFVTRPNDTGELLLFSGTAGSSYPVIALRGKNRSSEAGSCFIRTIDSSNIKILMMKPDGTLTWGGQPLLPVGVVQAFAGNTIPTGWLLCDGSAVSRTTYANLYACIGDTYGAGDGSTTFNLPNLVNKFIEGSSTAGTEKSAGLPNIEAYFSLRPSTSTSSASLISRSGGSFTRGGATDTSAIGITTGSVSKVFEQVNLDASLSSSVYGNSTTVQPPALTMKYIIKY